MTWDEHERYNDLSCRRKKCSFFLILINIIISAADTLTFKKYHIPAYLSVPFLIEMHPLRNNFPIFFLEIIITSHFCEFA